MNVFLRWASLLNRAGSKANAALYRGGLKKSRRCPIPVLSVGNIGFGGSGKTPLVIRLLEEAEEWGFRPAVVTRGYKGDWEKRGGILSRGRGCLGTWREGGDDPYMIARRLPRAGVYVGANRYRSCLNASRDGFQLAILDDGFQHLKLERDLDIVIHRPGTTLLRESPEALRRADFILLPENPPPGKGKNLKDRAGNPEIFSFTFFAEGLFDMEGLPVDSNRLAGRRLAAFCGIAGPGRFRASLKSLGLKVDTFLAFPDHHPYPPSSLKRLRGLGGPDTVYLTTEKDIFKIPRDALGRTELYGLRIGLRISDEFFTRLKERLSLPAEDGGGKA
jgi:tetraacyldisaccharide 4'-kinase